VKHRPGQIRARHAASVAGRKRREEALVARHPGPEIEGESRDGAVSPSRAARFSTSRAWPPGPPGDELHGLEKLQAVDGHAQAAGFGAQTAMAAYEPAFEQGVVGPAGLDLEVDVVENVQTTAKPSAAATAPEGEGGVDPARRGKKAHPGVYFPKTAHPQHESLFGKLHLPLLAPQTTPSAAPRPPNRSRRPTSAARPPWRPVILLPKVPRVRDWEPQDFF
jgi:hypothetical protein